MGESALAEDERNDHSLRAATVFGVFDGVARWIFRLLRGRTANRQQKLFQSGGFARYRDWQIAPGKKSDSGGDKENGHSRHK